MDLGVMVLKHNVNPIQKSLEWKRGAQYTLSWGEVIPRANPLFWSEKFFTQENELLNEALGRQEWGIHFFPQASLSWPRGG